MIASNPRIGIFGAGAIGTSVGADLTASGHNVSLVDAWPAHIEAIREHGICVGMPDRELRVQAHALHICDLASLTEKFDLILLASKSNDHRWLAELAKDHLVDDGVLVPLQNGMNDDSIASIVGRERVLGCVVELSAEIFTPGVVKRNTDPAKTWFALGELDGRKSERLDSVANLLSVSARVQVTDNIYGTKWTKLIANTMTMGPFGLLGLYNHEAPALPGMFNISVQLGKESLAVGTALGYRIEPVFGLTAEEFTGSGEEKLVAAMKKLLSHISRGRTAPIHDHIKKRRSEIRFINGVVSDRGRELGIPTPANDAVVEIDRRINDGLIPMSPANFELLKELVGVREPA